jgi:hypothetical protein
MVLQRGKEEDGELRKNDDGVGNAGVFVMENGSGS